MNWKNQNLNSFRRKRADVDHMVRQNFIKGDQAVIPCHAEKYEDIISSYSTKGYETLNPSFQDYLFDIARFIPEEYGIVLDISGAAFTQKEKDAIVETLRIDLLYNLGEKEEQDREAFRSFWLMVLGCVVMGIFLSVVNFVVEIAKEFFYIIFWFFADTLVRYLLHDRHEKRYNRMLAGRLASVTVRFSDDAAEGK